MKNKKKVSIEPLKLQNSSQKELDIYGEKIIGLEYNDVDFNNCNFRSCTFKNCEFNLIQFIYCRFIKCKFIDCNFTTCAFPYTLLSMSKFLKCTLFEIDVYGLSIWDCSLDKKTTQDKIYVIPKDKFPRVSEKFTVNDILTAGMVGPLLEQNEKFPSLINNLQKNTILILGRFGRVAMERLKEIQKSLKERLGWLKLNIMLQSVPGDS